MERAAGDKIGAGFFEMNVRIDHIDDVDAIQNGLDEIRWNHRFIIKISDDWGQRA